MDPAVHGGFVPAYSFSERASGSAEGGGSEGVGQTVLSFNPGDIGGHGDVAR